jgi:hypothetical protein
MAYDYDTSKQEDHRDCDHPGCFDEGIYRAPKSRGDLRDYHWFCLDHVRAYNRTWNYCAGMTEAEIEDEIRRSTIWDRPTWRPGGPAGYEERIRKTIHDSGGFYGFGPGEYAGVSRSTTPEGKALAVLGLHESATFDQIKLRYRELAKQHHPDRNAGDKTAEDRLRTVIQAFNTLKQAHQSDKAA